MVMMLAPLARVGVRSAGRSLYISFYPTFVQIFLNADVVGATLLTLPTATDSNGGTVTWTLLSNPDATKVGGKGEGRAGGGGMAPTGHACACTRG